MLKKQTDIEKVTSKGHPFFIYGLKLKKISNKVDYNRYLIVISTKYDKRAVVRNKTRRRIKTVLQNLDNQIKKGYDIALYVSPQIKNIDFKDLKKKMFGLLNKAQIIQK